MKRKSARPLNDSAFEMIAARFKVLSEPMRLKILHALEQRELTVTELVAATGATQANVSKHLGILLDNLFVSRRKAGLNAYYRLHDDSVFYLCDAVCTTLGEKLAEQQTAVRSFRK